MRDEISSEFISVIARSLQDACQGCVDFNRTIQILGHIYLCVDSETHYDYILNEKLCKNSGDARTVALSKSFCADYPLTRGNLDSSLIEINTSDSTGTPSGPDRCNDAGNTLSSGTLGAAEAPELGNRNAEAPFVEVLKPSVVTGMKRKKRKGSPCKIQLPLADCPFDDDSLVHSQNAEDEAKRVSISPGEMQERGLAISSECQGTLPSQSDSLHNNSDNTDLQISKIFTLQTVARNHQHSCATSRGNEKCPSRIDLSIVKKEVLESEFPNSTAQTDLEATPTSSRVTLPFQNWCHQSLRDGHLQAKEGGPGTAKLKQGTSGEGAAIHAADGVDMDADSVSWMQKIPSVEAERGENAEQAVSISSPCRPSVSLATPASWPLPLLSSTPPTQHLRFLGSSSTPSMVHVYGSYSNEEQTPPGLGFSDQSFCDSGGKTLSTAAMRMRRYRQRLKEDKEKYEQHRERQSRYAKTYLSSLTEEQKAKRREKVKMCMREWRRKKRKEQGVVKEEPDSQGEEGQFMQLPSPVFQCATDEPAQMTM